jgi:hypothetical protein
MDLKKRLSFAHGYSTFDWLKVVFSDEACVWTGAKGRVYVRRPRGTDIAFRQEYCSNHEHKGDKVII